MPATPAVVLYWLRNTMSAIHDKPTRRGFLGAIAAIGAAVRIGPVPQQVMAEVVLPQAAPIIAPEELPIGWHLCSSTAVSAKDFDGLRESSIVIRPGEPTEYFLGPDWLRDFVDSKDTSRHEPS